MANTSATAPEPDAYAHGNRILIVSRDGLIVSTLESPTSGAKKHDPAAGCRSVDELWPREQAQAIRQSLKRAVRTRHSQSDEFESSPDGSHLEIIYVPQGPDRVLLIVRDLSQQKIALSKVRKLAYTDETTGLPNREFLFAELQKITDMQRLKQGRAAMICIHVGRFDDQGYALNSTQQAEVLQELATRLKSHLRGSNDERERDYERYSVAARTDFRQFGIVLPSIESGEDAEAVVQRIVNDLKEPVVVGRRTVSVKACGGVALFPQDGTDPASLFENASAAMEDARNEPDSTYKFHSGTIRLRTLQRQDLEVELKSALERREYAVSHLPIVDAADRRPVIVESLLRWPDTILGTQPTRKIVRVAERTGLILAIGEWVLRHTCEQLAEWRAAGHEDVRIAINLSGQELASDGIVERIAEIFDDTGTNAADVDFELKEHMLFREVLKDYATCRALKDLGARIVVDDYGIGACSLAHLSQSPVDAIKIDNTFVANIEANERDRAACAAATAMARELGIVVIAEGVETEHQAEVLRDAGCDYLQGFLFGEPMTDAEMLDYLKNSASQAQAARREVR